MHTLNSHHSHTCITDRTQVYAEVQKMNAKYKLPGTLHVNGFTKHGFEGIFGDQSVFFDGLEAYSGRPMVCAWLSVSAPVTRALLRRTHKHTHTHTHTLTHAHIRMRASAHTQVATDDQLFEEMAREFKECTDPRVHFITTTNYGGIKTDLITEWEFVADIHMDRVYPGQVGHTSKMPNENRHYDGRTPIALAELMRHEYAKKANLMRVEVLGLRLYTGPAFMAINGSLRFAFFKKGKKDCLPVIDPMLSKHFSAGSSRTVADLQTELLKGPSFVEYFHSNSASAAKYVEDLLAPERAARYFKDLQNVQDEECERFCAFEGGCGKRQYGACNNQSTCSSCAESKFWDCPNRVKATCSKCAPGIDAFTNTIAVVNSAIKKLSKVAHYRLYFVPSNMICNFFGFYCA